MRNKAKIAICLILITGLIAITSNQLISPVESEPPFETDPHDPGNSQGPGDLTGISPSDNIDFIFVCEDTDFSQINYQL